MNYESHTDGICPSVKLWNLVVKYEIQKDPWKHLTILFKDYISNLLYIKKHIYQNNLDNSLLVKKSFFL